MMLLIVMATFVWYCHYSKQYVFCNSTVCHALLDTRVATIQFVEVSKYCLWCTMIQQYIVQYKVESKQWSMLFLMLLFFFVFFKRNK